MQPLIAAHAALLGRIRWVAAMVGVAASWFWIFEIRRGAGPSRIHLLSVWTLGSLGLAVCRIGDRGVTGRRPQRSLPRPLSC